MTRKEFKISYYDIDVNQSNPYPAWVELNFSSDSGTNFRFQVRPEDFIQFVDALNSYCKYELKDSDGKELLYK